MLLDKKGALVTGASQGIGRGIALEMTREGADIIVNYNNSKEKANEVAHSIETLGRRSSLSRLTSQTKTKLKPCENQS